MTDASNAGRSAQEAQEDWASTPAPAVSRTVEDRVDARPGILLLLCSCLPVLGVVLLSPAQPAIADHFSETTGVTVLVPLILTIPGLAIALLAPFAGLAADRFGRKRLLIAAMVIYAAFGTAPLWLESLTAIVVSRVGVGAAEAVTITVATTLIADYYTGRQRDKFLGLQVLVTTVSATLFLVLGGVLGSNGWRTPFWMYAVSLLLILPMMALLTEPARTGAVENERLRSLRGLRLPLAVTVFGGFTFYCLLINLPYVMSDLGIRDESQIGFAAAIASLGTATGAFFFGRWGGWPVQRLLFCSFTCAAVGLAIVAMALSPMPALVGAVVTSFGAGLLLPSLLTWAVNSLTPENRGRGTGLWQTCLWLGQFGTPFVIGALAAVSGGLQSALGIFGIAVAVAACLSLVSARRGARSDHRH